MKSSPFCPSLTTWRHHLFRKIAFFAFATAGILVAQGANRDESGASHIRDTPPLSPEEQLKTFRLPPGFEIELFAAEPDIGKPINMAFDAAGRLWVTQSSEYPFAAEQGEGRDRISVLEDSTGDGRADALVHFASDLNIPIGIQPMVDGAIGYSIPSLYRFYDHTGDLHADRREALIGPFQFVDTHGMVNNLIRGFDGWIHACHGFHNESTVSALDGRDITLRSGSTFRFRPNGSRMEVTTTGRVNPFGQAYDEWGYLYSSDCHSTPIYQLIRGADYPTFHRGPAGIGYGPRMMKHGHGPTAISGLAFYTAQQFPPEYRENFYTGNVVSNRVKRDSLRWEGATPVAIQEPDFLVSDDPWFRPVDLQVGPDGALYVADFYNLIIGHYEVPHDHPGRDRHRGRIWRIFYRDDDQELNPAPSPNLRFPSIEELLENLADANLSVRFLAADEIADRIGLKAVEPLLSSWSSQAAPPAQKVMILWVLHRLDALPGDLLEKAMDSPEEVIRVHATRILSEMTAPNERHGELARKALGDISAHVRRAAAEVLARLPDAAHVHLLLDLYQRTPARDTHLLYTLRQSLRDNLRDEATLSYVLAADWNERDAALLADAMTGVDHSDAAAFLLGFLERRSEEAETMKRYLQHAALHVPEDQLATFAAIGREVADGEIAVEIDLFQAMQSAAQQRGLALSTEARNWGEEIASRAIARSEAAGGWRYFPQPETGPSGDPWAVRPLPSEDGQTLPFLTTRTIDESFTGTLRSPDFPLPKTLSFYLAGHSGFPGEAAHGKNKILLRSARDGAPIREVLPPRNDVAIKVEWNLAGRQGERAYLELVDGDSAHAYAWIGAGRFDPPLIEVPEIGTGELQRDMLRGIRIAQELRAKTLLSELERLLLASDEGEPLRVAAAEAIGAIDLQASIPLFIDILADQEEPAKLRNAAAVVLARANSAGAEDMLSETIARASPPVQLSIAAELASTSQGRIRLLDMTANGRFPAHLLLDPAIAERLVGELNPSNLARYRELTDGISPSDARLQKKIDQAIESFRPELVQPAEGRQLFELHCGACHEVAGRGGRVGPQLDGIGNWSPERLIEKIMAPNRNVSRSFQYTIVTLSDGRTFTGLLQREAGETLIFADATGREKAIAKSDIVERRASPNSLMPPVYGDTLSREELHAIIGYLLTLE